MTNDEKKFFVFNRLRDQQLLERNRLRENSLLPEATGSSATRLPTSPSSQASSQRSTSTPRAPGTYEEWQARQRRDYEAMNLSVSGVFSPIRGDLSVPAGTMYRPWNRSELKAFNDHTTASQGTTRATSGSLSLIDMTGPAVVNETELDNPSQSLRRTVTFNNMTEVEMEDCGSDPEEDSSTQRPEK